MRHSPGSLSKGQGILVNWDERYVRELTRLGYLSPLATILHRAFSGEYSLYDATIVYNLFTNQDAGVYTLAQLQNFKSDLDSFSAGWLDNKEKGEEFLQILRKDLFGEGFLAQATFSSYWLSHGMNQHLLGVLSARVNQWIKMKKSAESDLLDNLIV